MNSWSLTKSEKFNASNKSCARYCRHYWLDMHEQSGWVRQRDELEIRQIGNSVFYLQKESFIAEGLRQAQKSGVQRIIYQPRPL